jgi:hypothetical protein
MRRFFILLLLLFLPGAHHSAAASPAKSASSRFDVQHGSVLLEVRERLREAGVPVRDVQEAAHLFVFVQAARERAARSRAAA